METRLKNLDGNGCNDSPCNCIVFFSVLLHVSFNRLQLIFREGVRVGSTQDSTTAGEPISSRWIVLPLQVHAARPELGYSIVSCLHKRLHYSGRINI